MRRGWEGARRPARRRRARGAGRQARPRGPLRAHARLCEQRAKVADGLVKFLLARDALGQVELPADPRRRVEERHRVPARRGGRRGREPGRPGADDSDALPVRRADGREIERSLVAGTRVDQAARLRQGGAGGSAGGPVRRARPTPGRSGADGQRQRARAPQDLPTSLSPHGRAGGCADRRASPARCAASPAWPGRCGRGRPGCSRCCRAQRGRRQSGRQPVRWRSAPRLCGQSEARAVRGLLTRC